MLNSEGSVERSCVADMLEELARDLHNVAFDFREPARSIAYAEHRIAMVEQIVARLRVVVRGHG